MDDFNINIFETYLAGQLSESDKLEFESRLISDQAFAKDFENFKILQAGIRLQAMQNRLATLKANINKDADKDDVIKPILKRNYWTWSLVSILVLSVLGYVIYTQTLPVSKQINVKQDQVINLDSLDQKASSKGQQSETLPAVDSAETFNKVLKPKISLEKSGITKPQKQIKKNEIIADEKGKKITRSDVMVLYSAIMRDDGSENTEYSKAVELYRNSAYKEALDIIVDNVDDEKSQYLTAHCYLLLGQSDKATSMFKSFIENDFSSFHEPSKWYYVLALYSGLPATKSELIKAIELVKDNPEYQKKLKKIQEDI